MFGRNLCEYVCSGNGAKCDPGRVSVRKFVQRGVGVAVRKCVRGGVDVRACVRRGVSVSACGG